MIGSLPVAAIGSIADMFVAIAIIAMVTNNIGLESLVCDGK
jgi:hypothetical protein